MLEADGGQTSAPIHRQVRTRSGRPHSVEGIADFELEAIAFQCLKIGLARDRVDQLDDVADMAGRLRELADLLGGRACLADSVVCYARRVLHLAADLVDGRRQFFRCGCDGLHVGRSLLGCGRDDRRQFLRTLSGSRQRTRGGFEFGGGRRDRFDDLSDGGLNWLAKRYMFWRRWSAASLSCSVLASASRCAFSASIVLTLSTARAVSPISSRLVDRAVAESDNEMDSHQLPRWTWGIGA